MQNQSIFTSALRNFNPHCVWLYNKNVYFWIEFSFQITVFKIQDSLLVLPLVGVFCLEKSVHCRAVMIHCFMLLCCLAKGLQREGFLEMLYKGLSQRSTEDSLWRREVMNKQNFSYLLKAYLYFCSLVQDLQFSLWNG